MKYSPIRPNNSNMALAGALLGEVCMVGFNEVSGMYSNYVQIEAVDGWEYDVEFSPDATKLYYTTYSNPFSLSQYDFTTPAISMIYSNENVGGGLKLGPDGIIYVNINQSSQSLATIVNPNGNAASCGFNEFGLDLSSGLVQDWNGFGFPINIAVPTFFPSISDDVAICEGESTTLLAENGTTFLWSPDDGTLSDINIANPVATPTQTTTYSVIITDANGCSEVLDVVVTVNNIDVDLGNDLFICPNETVQIDALVPAGLAPYTYSWTPASYYNASNPSSITTNQLGTYSVEVTDANGCSATDEVVVNNVLNLSKTANIGNTVATAVYSGQTVTYDITVCNNTPNVLTGVSISDVLPIYFQLDLASLPVGLAFDGSATISGIVNLNPGCTTFTYEGHYNVSFSSTTPAVVLQDPNVVTVIVNNCHITGVTGTYVADNSVPVPESCPGYNRISPSIVNRSIPQGTLIVDYLNVHRPYFNMTNVEYELYYPYFLDAFADPTNDFIVNGQMTVTNSPLDPVIQNKETPVSALYKKLTVKLNINAFDIGTIDGDYPSGIYVGNIIGVKFVTNQDLNTSNVPLDQYQFFVKSIAEQATNRVDFTLQDENNVSYSTSPLIQYNFLAIENQTADPMLADFQVVADPCTNKVTVSSQAEGLHRWEFNDPNNPFVPIWGNTFTWEYAQAGTYNITHTYINTDGVVIVMTKSVTLTPVAFDYPSGMTITSASQSITDINSDGFIRVRGPVTIASGVTYQINNKTIEFADDLLPDPEDLPRTHSGIIVNRNATLNLNNSTLRSVSTCPTSMWQGIQVFGDEPIIIVAEPGSNPSKGHLGQMSQPLQNGKLNTSNSIIEEARIGIAAYKVFVPFGQQQNEYGRGLINANTTTFRNNHISIGFKGRTFVENASIVKACIFTNTADLKDVTLFPSQGIKTYVQLDQVKNVQILANAFYGRTSYAPEKRGNGIVSYDAAYTVTSANTSTQQGSSPTPNSFAHLTKGIDVYSTGGANKVVRVKNNSFNQVVQGITANGSNFDEISFNTFNVPLGSETLDSWGINLYKSAGFTCTENTFNSAQSNPYTFGLLSRSTMLASGQVYKNNFSGRFFSATQAEQENTQLQIKCNTYSGINNFDWTVTSGVLANQGECSIDPTTPAGNIFGICNDHDESQIWKNPIVPDFAYRTHPNRAPVCYTPTIFVEDCSVNANTNSCPTIVSNPCPNVRMWLRVNIRDAALGLEKDR
jgi:uncharacterized repeat protein (TIGR01451 family)